MHPSPKTKETYKDDGKAQRIKLPRDHGGLCQALKKGEVAVMSLLLINSTTIRNPREMGSYLACLPLARVDVELIRYEFMDKPRKVGLASSYYLILLAKL